MGTNYYLTGEDVPSYSEDGPGLHVGKKSAGWDFMFRSYPDLGLTTVAAWRDYASRPGRLVISEYHDVRPLDEFFAMATARPVDDTDISRCHRGIHLGDPRFHIDMDARGAPFLNQEFC